MSKEPADDWSDDSDDELDDYTISKMVIVTQTPPPPKRTSKHEGFDRTGNYTTRTKMTQDLAHMISAGLYYYEQDLFDEDEDGYYQKKHNLSGSQSNVGMISEAEFSSLKRDEDSDSEVFQHHSHDKTSHVSSVQKTSSKENLNISRESSG